VSPSTSDCCSALLCSTASCAYDLRHPLPSSRHRPSFFLSLPLTLPASRALLSLLPFLLINPALSIILLYLAYLYSLLELLSPPFRLLAASKASSTPPPPPPLRPIASSSDHPRSGTLGSITACASTSSWSGRSCQHKSGWRFFAPQRQDNGSKPPRPARLCLPSRALWRRYLHRAISVSACGRRALSRSLYRASAAWLHCMGDKLQSQ
jgi:hypothetical protein